MAETFRQTFSPIIHEFLRARPGFPLKVLRRMLVKEWHKVKTIETEYMQSEWSKEVTRQLSTHKDNQKPVDFGLFEKD